MANIIGPGSIKQETVAPKSSLDGAGDYEYVTIHNPLSDDFQVQVAQDVPVSMPFEIRNKTATVQSESDVARTLGFPLKNPDHRAKKYIYNTAIIPAGGTMNFKGGEAQVVVRQLTNEILQQEGKRRLMSDPTLRKEVEDRIVKKRGSVQDLLDERMVTPLQQVNQAINQSNEVQNEEAFAGLNRGQEAGTGDAPVVDTSVKDGMGRTKKANS